METIDSVLDRLEELHSASVARLRKDVIAFGRDRSLPPAERRRDGSYAYPELRLRYSGGEQPASSGRAFGRLNTPGLYATTITRPALFRDYLRDQLELIAANYRVEFAVEASPQEIPFPYVLDGEAGAELAEPAGERAATGVVARARRREGWRLFQHGLCHTSVGSLRAVS